MKILHLEDDRHDAELTHVVFHQEWPGCEVAVVSTRPEFLAQLSRGGHDLILSDFKLTNFNGMEALKLAREQRPDVPFLFLSGTIGEDQAIEAMRAGATDYVIKDRPKRLVPAIRRALDEARHRQERQAAEEQLLRVQRLENIGMLAAGIAHDFNNVLAPVLMAVPLLRDRLTEPTDQRILECVEESARRGAGLVREIVGFAQGVTGESQILQPRHLLRDLVRVMRQTFPRAIGIEVEVEPGLWPLRANPTQLHQVLLNLCVNARDSMPEGGTLTIRASNWQLDEPGRPEAAGLEAGPHLRFDVSDTGTGIPPEVLARIWEPFFTTKAAGQGTGLGLPTVRAIVEAHHGIVTVESRAGQGTRFQVCLPAAPFAQATEGPGERATLRQGQGELILVVDDDPSVRDLTAAILDRNGYRVLAAADGVEAVALFAPRSLEIRAVVTDLSMPQLDGFGLIKIIRNLSPTTRIVAMSGRAEHQSRLEGQDSRCECLLKPFTSDALLTALHSLLHA